MSTRTPKTISANHASRRAAAWLLGAAALLSGCSWFGGSSTPSVPMGTPGHVRGFLGGAIADEPRAALVSREILSAGGTAVDAAIAGAFAMGVTLPSRAGLGGGGACLVYNARLRNVITVSFPAGRRAALPPGTDRPAAVPLMARGLFLMHTRGGRLRFEQLVRPAEDLARFGTEVSAALSEDLAVVAAPLLNDPQSRRVFGAPGGGPLRGGERLVQLDLGATLAQLRSGGVGELYQGPLSQRLEDASLLAGGGLTASELRETLAEVVEPVRVPVGQDVAFFLPAVGDGAAGTQAAFQAIQAGSAPPSGGGLSGASAGLVTMDAEGNAVSCAFSMNNLFGTGRIAEGTGILLAAAPGMGSVPAAPLAVTMATNRELRAFRAATAGTGQQAAGIAAATMLATAFGRQPLENGFAAIPEPGRGLAMSCPAYMPGGNASCVAAADPRGGGVAAGSFAP
ncbi:gamma-glutamyltranspeptidase [Roseomonas terrae]|uniref:Gamma-glutamyltranspeptidase n=1 Tax=Neoroseomonas terrae TaxID=424799 RepID=A0ABS5EQJ1_9PROT|nr:gamma-glutamyltransferase [Neoroseomonas terrae]MBR0653313.1 gamma-glutamyltranspeptidase [Neoroseomonas terrae]